jgi:hypothetical protein
MDDELCNFFLDGEYCHCDTEVMPKKKAIIKRIAEIKAKEKEIELDSEFTALKLLRSSKKLDINLKLSYKDHKDHKDHKVKIGCKRKHCCLTDEIT